jgi:hypothetical protein
MVATIVGLDIAPDAVNMALERLLIIALVPAMRVFQVDAQAALIGNILLDIEQGSCSLSLIRRPPLTRPGVRAAAGGRAWRSDTITILMEC